MKNRPTKLAIAVEITALVAAVAAAIWFAPEADWDPVLLGTLLLLAVASDLMSIEVRANRIAVSASFLATVLVAVFAGATPAAIVGVSTILVGWARERYEPSFLLVNVVTYAWFPLIAGIVFSAVSAAGTSRSARPSTTS